MKIPQIRMESQFAQIQMRQIPTKLMIKQERADMTIEQPKAELSMQTTKGKMHIDLTKVWEDLHLMSTIRLNEIFAQEGMQAAREGVARRAEQGAELIRIEENRDVISEQAVQNGHRQMKRLSIKYIPSPFAVKINYELGDLQIDVQTKKPNIQVQVKKPEIEAQHGNVNISMARYADLKIDFVHLFDKS